MSFIQKVSASFDNTSVAGGTLTGVVAGNTLIYIIGSSEPNPYSLPTDSSGQTWVKAINPAVTGGLAQTAIYYLLNANAGVHTLTHTLSAGQFGAKTLVEVPACSAVDVSTSNGAVATGTGGNTGTTSTTTQSNDIVIACLTTNTTGSGLAASGITDPPSGFTSLFAQQDSVNHTGAQHSYLETSALGAQSAAWTWGLNTATAWQACIATFKIAGGAAAIFDDAVLPLNRPRPGRGPYSLGRYYRPVGDTNIQTLLVGITSATTDGADVLASNAGALVSAISATTDGADTLAASAGALVSASSSTTDGADTLSASIGLQVGSSSATTDGADVLAANVGSLVSLSSATTDGADVLVANVAPQSSGVSATSATTDGADVLASNMSVLVAASSATTDGADVLSANVGLLVIPSASSSTTDGADVLSAQAGALVSASSGTTDGADVLLAQVSPLSTLSISVAVTDGSDVLLSNLDTGAPPYAPGNDGAGVPMHKWRYYADDEPEPTPAKKKETQKEAQKAVAKVVAQIPAELAPTKRVELIEAIKKSVGESPVVVKAILAQPIKGLAEAEKALADAIAIALDDEEAIALALQLLD